MSIIMMQLLQGNHFWSGAVAHCQYISKFETNQSSLEFLFDFLIHKRFAKAIFWFWSSNKTKEKTECGFGLLKESFEPAL
jgi:hypothetical protein